MGTESKRSRADPYGQTLTRRLESMFLANPSQVLTEEECCHRLDCTPKQLRNALSQLKRKRRQSQIGFIQMVGILVSEDTK